jgi:hypothetical protein
MGMRQPGVKIIFEWDLKNAWDKHQGIIKTKNLSGIRRGFLFSVKINYLLIIILWVYTFPFMVSLQKYNPAATDCELKSSDTVSPA